MTGLSVGLKEGMILILVSVAVNLVLYGLSNAGVIQCPNEYTSYINNTFNTNANETESTTGFLKTMLNMMTNKCSGVPLWLYWVSIGIFVLGFGMMVLAVVPFT